MWKSAVAGPVIIMADSAKKETGWASYLGAAALVGAAAGYAALALRFRNFGNNPQKFTSGGSEFKAAQAFSRDWAKTAEQADGAAAEAARERARRAYREAFSDFQSRAAGSGSSSSSGQGRSQQQRPSTLEHQWALDELGLGASPTMAEGKRAYLERARACHPDSGGSNADAEAFKRLSRAWDEVQRHARR